MTPKDSVRPNGAVPNHWLSLVCPGKLPFMKNPLVHGMIAMEFLFTTARCIHAQSLQGLHIGEDQSLLEKLPDTMTRDLCW